MLIKHPKGCFFNINGNPLPKWGITQTWRGKKHGRTEYGNHRSQDFHTG